MFQTQRVITNIGGIETDASIALNDYRSGSQALAVTGADDSLYIASDLPFNHRHFEIATANTATATVSVAIWFGREWFSAVDVLDRTSAAGKSLSSSGIIQWSPDRVRGWDLEQDSEKVTGISAVGIYDKFWVRLKWSAALSGTTALKVVGHKFSNDTSLASYYPDLMSAGLMDAYQTGKTDWNEQHFMAAEQIIEDLTRRDIIESGSQILDHELFTAASCHKVGEIIYQALGQPFDNARARAQASYIAAMNKRLYRVDYDNDARLTPTERTLQVGWLKR